MSLYFKEDLLNPWQMGTHFTVLSESYPMNTNMTGFRWFSKILNPCALDESSLFIGRVNSQNESYSPKYAKKSRVTTFNLCPKCVGIDRTFYTGNLHLYQLMYTG